MQSVRHSRQVDYSTPRQDNFQFKKSLCFCFVVFFFFFFFYFFNLIISSI